MQSTASRLSPLASSARASRWAWVSLRRRPRRRLAVLQRGEHVLAGDQALGRLLGAVVALVAASHGSTGAAVHGCENLARQQAGIGLQRHAIGVAGVQARQVRAGIEQQRHARMQHEGHRRIDPFHAGAGASRPVGGAVGELAARRPRVAEGGEAWRESRRGSVRRSGAGRRNQSVGQPSVSTSSRGRPKGRSKPPTQGRRSVFNQAVNASSVSNRSIFDSEMCPFDAGELPLML